MKYSKREILKAGELGEINMIDVKHLVSLLDEAHALLNTTNSPHPLTAKIIEMYNDWYMIMMGVQPKITVQDGAMAKQVAKYLSDIVRSKNPEASDSDIVYAWQLILTKYPMQDKFYGTQLKLSQIGSNLNNLIALIRKNGQQSTENRSTSLINLARERFGEI